MVPQERERERERERETEMMKNREGTEQKRRKVSDPHGNRIKTLGKRNFSYGREEWEAGGGRRKGWRGG